MRGKAPAIVLQSTSSGITPAYAGKRVRGDVHVYVKKDHPRLCGEKETIKVGQVTGTGSPPPMRGKAHKSSGTAFLIRITPAYAGKRLNLQKSNKIV